MILPLADKWVRKAIHDAIDGIEVQGQTINVYDTHTGDLEPRFYILMTTQTSEEVQGNKCDSRWQSSILLDIVTRYPGAGNTGSRLMADQISEAILPLLDALQLDAASNLYIFNLRFSFPADISDKNDTENIFRKLIRLEMIIEEK